MRDWKMPTWMREALDVTTYMGHNVEAEYNHGCPISIRTVSVLNRLHAAGLLLAEGEKADYDQFKAYLKQLPEGYDIGDDATVELALKGVDLDNEIARLKAENAALLSEVERKRMEYQAIADADFNTRLVRELFKEESDDLARITDKHKEVGNG